MSSHTAQTELKLIGKVILEGDLECQTGLHIGAGKGSLEIGGADNPVVKDAFGLPYVPGSSLRGKLRSLLEQTRTVGSSNEASPFSPPWSTSSLKAYLENRGPEAIAEVNRWLESFRFGDPYAPPRKGGPCLSTQP